MHQINASYGCNMKRTRSNWSGWQSDALNKQFLTVYREESCYCFIDFSQENARDFDSFTQFLPIKCSATSSINPQLPVFKLFFLNERSKKKTLGRGPFLECPDTFLGTKSCSLWVIWLRAACLPETLVTANAI